MLIAGALILWLLAVLVAGLLMRRAILDDTIPPQPAPRDPVVELVDKWAHDWERGRA